MIPLLAILGFRKNNGRIVRFWIPLFLVWLLLLPLVLVLLPFAFVALVVIKLNPIHVFKAGWQVLSGLRGHHDEVEDVDVFVLIRIL